MGARAAKKVPDKWVRNRSDREAIRAGCHFDQDAADFVCDFIEAFLCHSTGRWAGKPFLLEDWQRDYLSRLFGWKRQDGTRRFRESYLEVPKKNGKSTLLAAIVILGIFEEAGAQVFVGARTRKQARTIFNECAAMIKASATLRRHLRVIDTTATITFEMTNSRLVAMSADADSQDGSNATIVVLDELHRFRNSKLYDVMKYAGAAREQPLLINITTAGTDRFSICYQQHKRALDVINEVTAEFEFLAVVYSADPDKDDLDDPKTWRKANPSLGTIIKLEDFAAEYAQAKRIPGRFNNFKRLRLNIWTDAATRWLPFDLWDAGNLPIDPSELAGRPCYAALDLSSVKDLTSLSLVFPIGQDFRVINYTWMPEDTASERSEADGVPYLEWIEDGWMIETPGNATDFGAIRSLLRELREEFSILAIGIDPWNAQSLANDLIEDEFEVVEIRQGYPTLTGPCKELERLLLAGRFKHDGNPVLRWAVGNCATEEDAQGNIKPSKKRSTERIDPVVSTVMALGLCSAESPGPKPRITVISKDDCAK